MPSGTLGAQPAPIAHWKSSGSPRHERRPRRRAAGTTRASSTPSDEHGQADHEAGQRARDADVEERRRSGNGLRMRMKAPNVPTSVTKPDGKGRDEEGQRGVHAVEPAGDVVAHLVGEQDAS